MQAGSNTAKGPIHGSALFDSRAPFCDKTVARRPIGTGARPVLATDPARVSTPRAARVPQRDAPAKGRRGGLAFALTLLAIAGASWAVRAAVDRGPTLMSQGEFAQARKAIEADTRLALAGCRDLAAAQKDICRAAARAEDRVKRAELAARYYGTVQTQNEARAARVKGAYEIARARCSAQLVEERQNCLKAAREDRNRLANEPQLASS